MKINISTFFVLCILITGCSIKRYVPEGQGLYVGANVRVESDSISKPNVSGLEDQLTNIIKPAPNKTILGFPWKVWFYYKIGEPKDEGGLRSWFRRKLGEPPVVATQRVVDINAANMAAYLDNQGFYRSTASGKLEVSKKRTAKANYYAYVMPRYVINEITYVLPDTFGINKDLKTAEKNTFLKKGDPVRLDVIVAERARIDQELKGHGYYYFNPDYLIIKVDSTIGRKDSTLVPQQVNLYLEVKKETAQNYLKQYYINRIFVNTGTVENLTADTAVNRGPLRRGLTIKDPGNLYKRRIFYEAIGFRRGALYTNKMQEISVTRLVNLQNFKFVKNNFELVPRSDSALLNVYYNLEPLKKKSAQVVLDGSTKSNNLTGAQIELKWKNRNFFKGGEILTLSGLYGQDFQLGGKRIDYPSKVGNEYTRWGATATLTFPRFMIPFYRIRPEKSQISPKTVLALNLKTEYKRTSTR